MDVIDPSRALRSGGVLLPGSGRSNSDEAEFRNPQSSIERGGIETEGCPQESSARKAQLPARDTWRRDRRTLRRAVTTARHPDTSVEAATRFCCNRQA